MGNQTKPGRVKWRGVSKGLTSPRTKDRPRSEIGPNSPHTHEAGQAQTAQEPNGGGSPHPGHPHSPSSNRA